jgi:hypothetical protein
MAFEFLGCWGELASDGWTQAVVVGMGLGLVGWFYRCSFGPDANVIFFLFLENKGREPCFDRKQ